MSIVYVSMLVCSYGVHDLCVTTSRFTLSPFSPSLFFSYVNDPFCQSLVYLYIYILFMFISIFYNSLDVPIKECIFLYSYSLVSLIFHHLNSIPIP